MRPEYWCILLTVTAALACTALAGLLRTERYYAPKLRARVLRLGETLMFIQFGMWIMWWAMVILYGERLFK